MNIWHDTPDASRTPRRVSPTQTVELTVGTWPIGPGQSVWIAWAAIGAKRNQADGIVAAQWQHNTDVNSYWTAHLGPFADGDRVTYTVHGSSGEDNVETTHFVIRVRPALYIAWLWHQHQPLYRDPAAPAPSGSYRYPWGRLHAIRDYYSMASLAAEHDVHVTINLTPVLLRQIDDYLQGGATDAALELTRRPAEELTSGQIEEVLSTFFDADWHHQVYEHPRYRELFEQRTCGARFSRQDIRDLQMWFNLAWFGHEFRAGEVRLTTGDSVNVHRFVGQQREFSHDDVLAMIDEQYKILRAIVPTHRELQASGHIEVSTTPLFHPILPLLIDTDRARVDRPGTFLPTRFAHREDAAAQIALATEDYAARFGTGPAGMWPAEAAVSIEAVEMMWRDGITWLATDAGVLARSGQWGYRTSEPDVLCQPYRASDDAIPAAVFFRDTDLSDGIGFRYGRYANPQEAVDDFVRTLEARFLTRLHDDADRVLTIALDGENAWGGYPDDGRPFLRALYRWLASDPRVKTVTFSEYLRGDTERGIDAHPPNTLARVYDLATGSWIDEPGSASGVDLGTWIGEPEENLAWNLLGTARQAYSAATGEGAASERARQSLFAAEGSDWYWWFGSDQESRNDATFDELFRGHLRDVYEALDVQVPEVLDDFIVAHPIVWTFTHPLVSIRHTDQVAIRTNCPGRLTYEVDDVPAEVHVNGYFTVAEYPVLEAYRGDHARTVTDLDILAFRFAGAGHDVIRGRGRRALGDRVTDPILQCPADRPDRRGERGRGPVQRRDARSSGTPSRSRALRLLSVGPRRRSRSQDSRPTVARPPPRRGSGRPFHSDARVWGRSGGPPRTGLDDRSHATRSAVPSELLEDALERLAARADQIRRSVCSP